MPGWLTVKVADDTGVAGALAAAMAIVYWPGTSGNTDTVPTEGIVMLPSALDIVAVGVTVAAACDVGYVVPFMTTPFIVRTYTVFG